MEELWLDVDANHLQLERHGAPRVPSSDWAENYAILIYKENYKTLDDEEVYPYCSVHYYGEE